VTRNAYLLFYRRRSSSPLGPPSLQEIVQGEVNPDSEQDSENETRSRSPVAGNGSRLGDLSRNGSSTAGAVGAGVEALARDGSALSAAGTHHGNEVGAGNLTDDDDEGFGDYDDGGFSGINASGGIDDVYGPSHTYDQPIWSFDNLKSSSPARDDSDVASDAPNLNSSDDEDLLTRIIEDFGDDNLSTNPVGSTTPIENIPLGAGGGPTTPMEDIPPRLGGEGGDGEVTEIRIPVD
jgi:ubiquitin carboxyl-terminal hydrolase 4/11/15